jgi:hypothetical protein
MVHEMKLPRRHVSALVLMGFVLAAVYSIVSGLLMRRKFFKQSAEAFPGDPPQMSLLLEGG